MTETAFHPQPFQPAAGLADPNAQTVFAALARPAFAAPLVRERWETPDGDFLDADLLRAPPGQPHLLVLHGLEGSSQAGYVGAALRAAQRRGWGAVALNFRSCSGEPNRLARSYHSGETGEVLHAIEQLRTWVRGPLFGLGFSLGANVLLRLLEETGETSPLAGAVAISAPYDLAACARALDTGRGFLAFYRWRFLRSLKGKARAKARRHPGVIDLERLQTADGIAAFDDVVTAPLHGFASAADYYAQCSSGVALEAIRRPALLISAEDDPMIPAETLPRRAEDNPFLTTLFSRHGGHVGFVAGSLARPSFWAEETALQFLERVFRSD